MLFLLKEQPGRDGLVRLCGDDYHYLVHVRRLKPGSVFPARLPEPGGKAAQGNLVNVTVLDIGKGILKGSVAQAEAASAGKTAPQGNAPPTILFQALPKGAKMDLIVRQATEMGISEIVPFISDYSIPKKSVSRLDRWSAIVKEARQQSHSSIETRVHEQLDEDGLFAYWEKIQKEHGNGALGLVFTPLVLENSGFHRYLNKKPPLLALAVGPEGGFSPAELDRFIGAGFKAISLGATVLRTETAALCGAAAAKIILMERADWKASQE